MVDDACENVHLCNAYKMYLGVLRCIKSRAFDTLAAAKNNFFFIKNS